jgi:hypothetical protein
MSCHIWSINESARIKTSNFMTIWLPYWFIEKAFLCLLFTLLMFLHTLTHDHKKCHFQDIFSTSHIYFIYLYTERMLADVSWMLDWTSSIFIIIFYFSLYLIHSFECPCPLNLQSGVKRVRNKNMKKVKRKCDHCYLPQVVSFFFDTFSH